MFNVRFANLAEIRRALLSGKSKPRFILVQLAESSTLEVLLDSNYQLENNKLLSRPESFTMQLVYLSLPSLVRRK